MVEGRNTFFNIMYAQRKSVFFSGRGMLSCQPPVPPPSVQARYRPPEPTYAAARARNLFLGTLLWGFRRRSELADWECVGVRKRETGCRCFPGPGLPRCVEARRQFCEDLVEQHLEMIHRAKGLSFTLQKSMFRVGHAELRIR